MTVDGQCYRLDFAIPEPMVAIEYDGEAYHSTPEQRRRDAIRQARLEAAGWSVVRVDRTELYSPEDGAILRRIAEAIRDQRHRGR